MSDTRQNQRFEPYEGHWPQVDPGAWVHSSAVLIGRIQIGPESTIWPQTALRGDDGHITIGSQTSVQDGTIIHATENLSDNTIGDRVTIGHNCTIHGAHIESDCIIGMGSILLDNCRIGHHCLIGAGSLVTQGVEIPPHSLVLGSPAQVVRPLRDKELEWIEYSWKRYVQQCHIYSARDRGGSTDE